jgi:hypothetical protein
MSLDTAIILNAVRSLGVVLALAVIMRLPFTFDRREREASTSALASPPAEDLAA